MNDVALEQSGGFKDMNQSMQNLAITFKESQDSSVTELAAAISNQGRLITDHINVTYQAQKEQANEEKEKEYRQVFLDSLIFPDILSREDGISLAYEKTFQWIFDQSGERIGPWSNLVK